MWSFSVPRHSPPSRRPRLRGRVGGGVTLAKHSSVKTGASGGRLSEFDPTKVDWGRVYAEALEIAHGFSPRGAEDLVQEGMTLVLEGTAPYDEASGKTLAEHLVEVALTAARNRARVERRRQGPKARAK